MRFGSWLFLGVVFCLGCSPRVWEVDAKLGVRVDSGSGFYAYYTAAPATDAGSIKLYVASEDSLLKPKSIREAASEVVYPIAFKDSEGVVVRPGLLARLIGAEGVGFEEQDPYVELGYFRKLIQEIDARPGAYVNNEEEIVPGGVSWGDPNDAMAKSIRNGLADCVDFAAEYGADAIIEAAVFYAPVANSPFGPSGFYLYGRAIAFQVD